MTSKVAYLDCSAGMSAELLLAALLDAGFSLDVLNSALSLLPIQSYQLKQTPVQRSGMRGSHLAIISSATAQSVRSLAEVIAIFQTGNLSVHNQETALAILHCFEEAHFAVTRATGSEILLPEVEALHVIICILGIVLGIASLEINQLYASPLPLTSGLVETAQGPQTVPAPITLEILRRVEAPWQPSSLEGERVTAIGAAILATLARFEQPTLTISGVGYAFDLAHPTNERCLRLYTGHLQSFENGRVEDADTDWVAVIESHVDTMTGELLGGLMERLFALGALDVSYTPLQMKKNRPASLVTVICPPEQGEQFALVLLRETSTLGVRIQHVRRLKAQREQRRINTPLGPAVVKIKRLGTRVISTAPEYEECRRISLERDMPLADVYDVVQQAIKNAII